MASLSIGLKVYCAQENTVEKVNCCVESLLKKCKNIDKYSWKNVNLYCNTIEKMHFWRKYENRISAIQVYK